MKYILSEVIERDISIPEIHNSKEDAQQAMAEKIAQALDIKSDDIMKLIQEAKQNGETIELDDFDNAGVGEFTGYCTVHGQNMDWHIHELI